MDTGFKYEQPLNPRVNANIFEILTFSWILNLFKIGKNKDLEIKDLYGTLNEHKSSMLGDELEKQWKKELNNAIKLNRQPSLIRTLIQMFGFKFFLYGILQSIVEIVLKTVQPFLIGGLLGYFNPNPSDRVDLTYAYMFAFGLVINMFVTLVLYHAIQIEVMHYGMKMRVACCSAIYKKALRLSKTALGKTTVGQVVNLLSNDVNRFDMAVVFLNYLWLGPIQTIVVTYILWKEIGVSSIIGVAVLLAVIPLQGWMGKKMSEYRLKTANRTDERVCLMNEIISGIQVIKMYTWEKSFANLVEHARKKEINQIKATSYCRTILLSFMVFHSRVALFSSLFVYIFLGNYISAQKVFVMMAYYNLLRTTMTTFFPQGIGTLAEMLVSIERLQNFLLYEETDDRMITNHSRVQMTVANSVEKIMVNNEYYESIVIDDENDASKTKDFGIVVSHATAKWADAQTVNTLENINFTVKSGRLAVIIGPVGAGKSSLIQAILRELPLSKGRIIMNGVVSYASQEPWLFASSVQQNILFGSPMDRTRYKKVLKVCALKMDMEQLPYGDRSIVGERGVSLSGGQKARINLARAVYKQADIYLLDDPLSAVDIHVGKHLFEKCILDFLRDKTCILITHQIQYLTNIDQIILMDNGTLISEGSYNKIESLELNFTKMIGSSTEIAFTDNNEYNTINTSTNNLCSRIALNRQISIRSITSSIEEVQFNELQENPVEVEETRSSGSVSRNVFMSYFFAGGTRCQILFLFFIFFFTQVLATVGDFWMAYWINLEEYVFFSVVYTVTKSSQQNSPIIWMQWLITRKICFIVFAVLILLLIVATSIRFITWVTFCAQSSMNLHNKMLNAIIKTTMYFFNTNLSGRILNRFSRDIGAIDEILPAAGMDCLQIGLCLISVVIVIGIINFYLMIPTFIIAVIFYKLRVYYISTSRSIKRLEGVTRSPVFAHLSTSLQGLITIRAYKAENILSREFDSHQDLHSSAWYLFITSSRAFGLWLDIVCFVYISIVTFSFLIIGNKTYGGNVGLVISQVIGLAGVFQWGMRQSAELENQMTSVERVLEYTNVPQEENFKSSKKPPFEWPTYGRITFKNFYLRYSIDSPFVVKNLNVQVEPMEKVGIVGRTGAGKSSLIGALFRLYINEGKIIIDDIEIHDLGLHELRSKLSIIPQEPVLFSGSMRMNLDPFNDYADHILWKALNEVELKDVVEGLPDGLNSKISEGGSNFSVGQRQLVCLARAIVRNNKILVLDEATANVDPQTDALIQSIIKNKFRMCTVLTIAHRLNTIMDSDRVLVMNAGTLIEFDHPHLLLNNKNGLLHKMVEQTGRSNCKLLHRIALDTYNKTMTMKES